MGLSPVSKEFEAYMTAHHYGAIKVETSDSIMNGQTVSVRINGREVTLGVDTGATFSVLNGGCARRLKLDVKSTGVAGDAFGGKINGGMGIAPIQSFEMGGWPVNHSSTIGVLPPGGHVAHADGLLGLDVLRLNAAVYPVAGSGILVKPGPTPAIPIAEYMTKLGYAGVPLTFGHQGLMMEGHLNGHELPCVIDTGASFSVFDYDFVCATLGHKITSMPLRLEGADRRALEEYRFEADELDFAGYHVPAVMMVANRSPVFGGECKAVIGVDLLGLHRAVIDLGGMKLWLK